MIDFHCHLDLYKNPIAIYNEAKAKQMFVLAVTTSPRAYIATSNHFCNSDKIVVALGFHPELVASRKSEHDLFFRLLPKCRYIGEIGIDGTERNKNSISIQKDFFEGVISEISNGESKKIVSIHSRGAVREVLSCLRASGKMCVPVLHWFTGSIKEAECALSIGCWFSINPKMCFSNKGQELIARIPLNRILPETDGPFASINNISYMPWDSTVVRYLAKFYGIPEIEIEKIMQANLQKISKS